ncbi:ATP-binding Cassette (ABC) superfamily [Achlya hypogyna]|uniref:ATP-binding Cassette (ABC) superfamily n=1 Tax=Achlya hypogyna TaxID=1202772 RepID=A0A1V9ZSG6_ACHHY|nr:ATP-binding Cassette (ABC) superfamily [Achlya hypogyna]
MQEALESPEASRSSRFSWSSGVPSVKNSLSAWTRPLYELDGDSTYEESSSVLTPHAREKTPRLRSRSCLLWCLVFWVIVCVAAVSALVYSLHWVAEDKVEKRARATVAALELRSECREDVPIYISYSTQNGPANYSLLALGTNASTTLSGESFADMTQGELHVGPTSNATRVTWSRSQESLAYGVSASNGFDVAVSISASASSCQSLICLDSTCAPTNASCPGGALRVNCSDPSPGLMRGAVLRVALFCGIFTLQCCITVLGSVTRDTIFLRIYDSRYISHMTVIMSFASAYAMTMTASLVQRGMRASVLACGFPCLSSAIMVGLWVFVTQLPELLYVSSILLYVWVEVAIQLLSQQFWDLCAAAFSVAESKQYFGAITFGSTLGTILASFIIIPLLKTYDVATEGNVLVVGLLQGILGAFMCFVTPIFAIQPRAKTNDPSAAASSSTIVSDIQNRSYLKHVCFFDMGATLIRVLVDYRTLSILSQHSEETLKYSLGAINGAQSFFMIPLQLASGPLFSYFGVMYGISTLPLAIVVFGAATYASSSPLLLIGTRALYNSVSHAIFNPARELLWLPLNTADRTKFKSFVVGPFRSIARVLGAVISIVLTSDMMQTYCGPSSVSAVMVLFGIAWFFDALAARQSYATEFYASLKKGHMDLTSPIIDFTTDQVSLVQATLRAGAANQVAFVLSFLQPSHVALFRSELRDVFHRADVSFHAQMRLVELHGAIQDDDKRIFSFEDLMAVYRSASAPHELRMACLLACGHERGVSSNELAVVLQEAPDVATTVSAAIALLRRTQWMDEGATIVLQKLLHEPRDVAAKVVCLRIVGRELPELLGNGYIVYLLHESQEPAIVHAALECCRQSKRASPMLLPALLKWLPDATFRTEAIEALQFFAPSVLWDHVVNFLDKAVTAVDLERLVGGIRLLEAAAFPADAKLDLLLSMMDSLVAADDGAELQLSQLLVLGRVALPAWEALADALLRIVDRLRADDSTDVVALVKRLDAVVAAHVFRGYQVRHLRMLFEDPHHHTLLSHVVEDTLDMLLRIVLKLVSARFPKGFNIHVLIEGLHADVPEVLSAVQEVLETLLPSSAKHTLLPLLFPAVPKAPMALQLAKEVAKLQLTSRTNILMRTMQDDAIAVELSCLALEYYLHAISCHDHDDVEEPARALTEGQAGRLLAHPITKDLVCRAFKDPQCRRAQALQHLFQNTTVEAADSPFTTFDIVMALRACALFRSIAVMELVQQIARHFSPRRVLAQTTFVREGALASEMFVLAAGEVQLHRASDLVVTTLEAGACVGELALLTSKGTHLASATTTTDCVLLEISRADLHALIHDNSGIARGVLDALASTLRWAYLQVGRALGLHSRGWKMETKEETSRLKRLVFASQVSVAANVDRAATTLLAKIGRNRSQSAHLPPRTKSHTHLLEYSSLTISAQTFEPVARPQEEVPMSHLEKCLHLKASHLMQQVDDELISTVAQMAQVVVLQARESLFAEGAPATSIYAVVEGTVVLTTSKDEAKKQLLHCGPASCFGELSFIRGSTHIMAATAAHARAVLLQIPTSEFVELAEKHTKLMHLVMAWMSRKITSKMKDDDATTSDTHLPLRLLPTSPIGSPRGSPRKQPWADDDDAFAIEANTGLRLRQNTM